MKKFLCFGLIAIFLLSCKTENDVQVTFDSDFPGARLDSVSVDQYGNYMAFINPAFEPVNKSPWFAFGITSKSEKPIKVTLNYGDYEHRYVPKLSTDKIVWTNIEDSNISIDTITGNATLTLNVSPQKLYVAAQELESSQRTYDWLNELMAAKSFLKKDVAGKTVKENDNYVVTTNDSLSKSIVLVARQHPPEIPGGTIGFKAFYEELLSDSETANSFREEFNIITFPLLNPDGADMGNWRHNANGKDLNRDWVEFSQPETQTVKAYVEKKIEEGGQIKFALDFHTSYSGPYMLVLDSINEVKTEKIIPNWISRIESMSTYKVEARRRSQELPYCYNYFFNKIGCEAVTYEDGDEIDRAIIKDRARIYARELMITLLAKKNEL